MATIRCMVNHLVSAPILDQADCFMDCRPASLQYLEWQDTKKYLATLHDRQDHIRNDAQYIVQLHTDILNPRNTQSKKEAKFVCVPSPFFSWTKIVSGTAAEFFVTCYHTSRVAQTLGSKYLYSGSWNTWRIKSNCNCCILC